jgi:hypothetical protein
MPAWIRTRALMVGLALLASVVCGVSASHAGSLTGDTIDGNLNFCTLGNGGNVFPTPSGTAPVTFEYVDGSNDDIATFTATTLTVEDQVTDVACGWGMSFYDQTAVFPLLTLISSNFSPDLAYDLTGGVISINWGGATGPVDFTAVFNIDGALPEPGPLAIFGVALAGVGVIRRRRAMRYDTSAA